MTAERTRDQALARMPMTAAQVRGIIAEMATAKTSRRSRIGMAELAIARANVTDEGRDEWRRYLAELTA